MLATPATHTATYHTCIAVLSQACRLALAKRKSAQAVVQVHTASTTSLASSVVDNINDKCL